MRWDDLAGLDTPTLNYPNTPPPKFICNYSYKTLIIRPRNHSPALRNTDPGASRVPYPDA
jgi:hypothetical protein